LSIYNWLCVLLKDKQDKEILPFFQEIPFTLSLNQAERKIRLQSFNDLENIIDNVFDKSSYGSIQEILLIVRYSDLVFTLPIEKIYVPRSAKRKLF